MRLLEHIAIAPARPASGAWWGETPSSRVSKPGLTRLDGVSPHHRLRRAFTLAEVLAALAFMAIVIPVTVQALRVASFAGQVGDRRSAAARVAERVMNEMVVTGAAGNGAQNGTIQEGVRTYRWTVTTEAWNPSTGRAASGSSAGTISSSTASSSGTLNLVTVRVAFDVQGEEHDVLLSTLLDTSVTTASATGTTSL